MSAERDADYIQQQPPAPQPETGLDGWMNINPTPYQTDILDALCYLNDIVGDLHETGRTSDTRLEGLQKAVNRLLEMVGPPKQQQADDCTDMDDGALLKMLKRAIFEAVRETIMAYSAESITEPDRTSTGESVTTESSADASSLSNSDAALRAQEDNP